MSKKTFLAAASRMYEELSGWRADHKGASFDEIAAVEPVVDAETGEIEVQLTRHSYRAGLSIAFAVLMLSFLLA